MLRFFIECFEWASCREECDIWRLNTETCELHTWYGAAWEKRYFDRDLEEYSEFPPSDQANAFYARKPGTPLDSHFTVEDFLVFAGLTEASEVSFEELIEIQGISENSRMLLIQDLV